MRAKCLVSIVVGLGLLSLSTPTMADWDLTLPEWSKPKLPELPKPKLPALPKPRLPSWQGVPWKSPAESQHLPPIERPSVAEKVAGGTKAFFSNAGKALTPWRKTDEPAPPEPLTGSRNARLAQRETSEKSWVPRWLKPPASIAPQQPESPGDFLGQPRPGF